jgi:hypothetical protein
LCVCIGEIINALANGADPYTGEILPNNSPYQNPETVRALFHALKGLKILDSREKRAKTLPRNAGKAWSEEEDQQLINSFEAGVMIKDLSTQHGRTQGAIQSRLVKLGKIVV